MNSCRRAMIWCTPQSGTRLSLRIMYVTRVFNITVFTGIVHNYGLYVNRIFVTRLLHLLRLITSNRKGYLPHPPNSSSQTQRFCFSSTVLNWHTLSPHTLPTPLKMMKETDESLCVALETRWNTLLNGTYRMNLHLILLSSFKIYSMPPDFQDLKHTALMFTYIHT